METINKVELQGTLGYCNISEVGEARFAKFSLCTQRVVKHGDAPAIETSWHSCVAFETGCRHFNVLESLSKGDGVHVIGRLKYSVFIDNNNSSHIVTEIIVGDVHHVISQPSCMSLANSESQE